MKRYAFLEKQSLTHVRAHVRAKKLNFLFRNCSISFFQARLSLAYRTDKEAI